MRLGLWLFLGAGIGLSIPSLSYGVTLTQVAREALATNPEVQASRANRRARAYDVGQALGQYLPQVTGRAAAGRERTANPTVRAQSKSHVTLSRSEFSVKASQLIIDGWGVGSSVQERMFDSRGAQHTVHATCNSVMLEVAEAYLNTKRHREIVAIAENNVKSHRETLRKVRLRYHGGAGTRVDEGLALSRLTRSEAELSSAQGRLAEAETRYCTVSSQTPPAYLAMPTRSEKWLPKNLFNAVMIAMHNNPAVLSSISTSQAAGARVGVAKSRFFPRLDAEFTARADNNLSGVEGPDGSMMGMAVLSYNFISGGSDIAAYNSASADHVQSQSKAQDLQRKVRERVRNAWTNYIATRDVIAHLHKNVQTNKLVVGDYIKQFELGQRQLFNVLDAQNDLYASQKAHTDAIYDNAIAYYRVLEAVGALSLDRLM